jgi:hypothetical protein
MSAQPQPAFLYHIPESRLQAKHPHEHPLFLLRQLLPDFGFNPTERTKQARGSVPPFVSIPPFQSAFENLTISGIKISISEKCSCIARAGRLPLAPSNLRQ